MEKLYKLFLITILLPVLCSAQSNYKPGFIITLKKDTIHGFIDLKNWSDNPATITFKPTADKSKPEVFGVNDISYFELINIVAYKKFMVSISLDETNIARIGYTRDTSARTDNVFLKAEETGKNITLYSYSDDLKTRYYVYDSQIGNIAELVYRIYFAPNNSSSKNAGATISQDAYKQQLLNIAQKFDTYKENFRSLIEEANYNVSDLADIFRKINGGSGMIKKHSSASVIKLFVGAAINSNTITPGGTFPFYNPTSYSTTTPAAAIGVSFSINPDVDKVLLKAEIGFSSAEYKTLVNFYADQPNFKTSYGFKQKTFSFTPQMQYNVYNSQSFKAYLDAGIAVNVSTYTGNTINNTQSGEQQDNYLALNKNWFAIPLKAGVIVAKHLDIFVGYNFPMSITNERNSTSIHQSYNYSLNISTVSAGLNYIF